MMEDNPQERLVAEMKLTQRLRKMNDNLSAKSQKQEKQIEFWRAVAWEAYNYSTSLPVDGRPAFPKPGDDVDAFGAALAEYGDKQEAHLLAEKDKLIKKLRREIASLLAERNNAINDQGAILEAVKILRKEKAELKGHLENAEQRVEELGGLQVGDYRHKVLVKESFDLGRQYAEKSTVGSTCSKCGAGRREDGSCDCKESTQ